MSLFFVLNNLIPLYGVLFLGWDWIFLVQFTVVEHFIATVFDLFREPLSQKDLPPKVKNIKQLSWNDKAHLFYIYLIGVVLGPIILLYEMFAACEVHMLAWSEFKLAAFISCISHTVQFVEDVWITRVASNMFRSTLISQSVLRAFIIVLAGVLGIFLGKLVIKGKIIVIIIVALRLGIGWALQTGRMKITAYVQPKRRA